MRGSTVVSKQKLPPELTLSSNNTTDYGPLYLSLILKCWCSPNRDDSLGPTLRVLIDSELYWVVDDVLEGCSNHDQIVIAEDALSKFAKIALSKMLAIAKRKVTKAKHNKYQGVEINDMRLAGIMSMFVSLIDQANEHVLEALTTETSPSNKLLPPPRQKDQKK